MMGMASFSQLLHRPETTEVTREQLEGYGSVNSTLLFPQNKCIYLDLNGNTYLGHMWHSDNQTAYHSFQIIYILNNQ